ncbi:hypothetical protein A0H81_04111 [Grifola frondosa]|uniref:Uncharacterized protein n=1 Tax=Grifola frondosa TaxID=5627 RepID=A0A1C7MGC8_GRIFR|nr:hypothetical protein A0H81_04111 [Grifola frondosa]
MLVEDRIKQLQETSNRRNGLLREMYHLLQRREDLGAVFTLDQDGGEGLQLFLNRFDLEKNPEAGSISKLDAETFIPSLPGSSHHVVNPDRLPQYRITAPTPQKPMNFVFDHTHYATDELMPIDQRNPLRYDELTPDYTLPPLNLLPAEFNRKGSPRNTRGSVTRSGRKALIGSLWELINGRRRARESCIQEGWKGHPNALALVIGR